MQIDWDALVKTEIIARDCAKESDDFFEIGKTTVKNGYRETAQVAHARFGYRFKIRDIHRPHLLEVIYPDDRPRMMLVNNGSSYDLSCGVFTEGKGGVHILRNLFWPRWEEETLLFCSWHADEPAAVCSFAVYELESLPPAVDLPTGRSFGIQYEDPCNVGASEGAYDIPGWLEHHVEYMKLSGANRLVYPIHWYHGPQVPVTCQPVDKTNTVITLDRKFYSRSTLIPNDWLEDLLTRFDEEGMLFTGSLTLQRLGNLMKIGNRDLDAVTAGADTVYNVTAQGQIQRSCNDWTLQYNSRIYPEKVAASGKLQEFAYGESRFPGGYNPMFNPLHPEVQRQLEEYFTELAQRYAAHRSFEGLSGNVWHGTILWFCNLAVGYDDCCFAQFEEDTGLRSDIQGEDRFRRRHKWVTDNHRDAFITWRCRKIAALIRRLRDALTAVRPDLTLTINMWNETSSPGHLPGILDTEAGQYGNRRSQYEIYREGGIDLRLLADEPNLILSIERNVARDRSKGPEVEKRHMFTDMSWLDEETYTILRDAPHTHNFNFNCWCEAWGKHSIFPCEADDPNVAFIERLADYKADYIFRENSAYEDDPENRLGTAQQLRIVSPFPVDYAEYLTAGLALHDALSITAGGLYLDKAHAEEQLAFAREYRKLPPVKFRTVTADPVTVRCHESGWVYALSREPYPIEVTVAEKNFVLKPFELKVWRGQPVEEAAVSVSVPAERIEEYGRHKEETTARLRESGNPTAALIADQIDDAFAAGAYARLRHLLVCYYAVKYR